ncbi:GNAT family N-acetyltransferase [Niastella yeongjuensis]|uniref:GNAT family N-acetyltransferase n=1 Tax=Niastella yeongjuensis TaxID=354355 RepID=A0A1V9EFY9_9BACT|nr:GNAT family N-acetyltransferase [Niastella yeongjuensis]OQP44845.1 GNAT family N-acetyltransferase [Niastella yeongjuensis]SEP42005.1 ribosomal-protein-alanine N-acetyltransferase [Niastella yeongjuensis]
MINRNFSPFPVLTTDRLVLRQLLASDIEEIFLLRSDPGINKYLDRQPSQMPADALRFITAINEGIAKNENLYWAITKADSQKLIGTICLFDFSDAHNSCEIGYELSTDFQRQGIMQEAAAGVIEFAFQTLGITTISAFSHRDNQSSMHLLQKLNFEKTGIRDESNTDMILFRLLVE